MNLSLLYQVVIAMVGNNKLVFETMYDETEYSKACLSSKNI